MFKDEEKKVAVDLALESRDRLMSAFLVAYSLDEIKKNILENFFLELKNEVQSLLKEEWKFDYTLDYTKSYGVGFGVTKNNWKDKGWWVWVESGRPGPDNFYYGLGKDVRESPLPSLKELLDNEQEASDSKENDHWIWYRYSDCHYRNWAAPDFLADLCFDKNSRRMVLEYFKHQIVTIAETADKYFSQHNI